MKNLVMEMEVAITCGETGFGNGAIIDSLSGTLENCVFDVTLHYDVDWGVWDSGLFTGVSDTAVIRNCAFIVNNHVSGFLFGRNNSDFTCENVAFIGKYDPKNNILKGSAESDQLPNANLHGIYLFTDLAQAVAGGGYALREDYADWASSTARRHGRTTRKHSATSSPRSLATSRAPGWSCSKLPYSSAGGIRPRNCEDRHEKI